MKRIGRVSVVVAAVFAGLAAMPAEAMIDQGFDTALHRQSLSICPALRAAMAKDASLAITVEGVQAEYANKEAVRSEVLESLDRTGALKEQPNLAIETLVEEADAPEGATVAALAVEESAVEPGAVAAVAGLCVRLSTGPGKVNWKWSNPGASPYYYSYKPESTTPLKWASAPDDALDAMYKRSWSACSALKVPDSATITVNSNGTWTKCENAAMALLGHVVKWVNTCSGPESSFPDDGL